ncbi:oligosaccharide repeat unit polymerase [Candidatus Peregrinibacteria bacterium]|nr:oligosaccharide repeat unit polymerase [Candidatus Peregrinibacteria bacterium]
MFNVLVYLGLILVPLIFVPALALPFEIPKIIVFRSLTLLMILAFIVDLAKSKTLVLPEVFRDRNFKKLLVGFLIVLVVGVAFSVAPQMSFWGSYYRQQGALSWMFYFLFFGLLCLKFNKKDQWDKAFKALYLGLFLVVIFAVNQAFGFAFEELNMNLAERSLGRISSGLGHPNYLASYLLLIIFPLLSTYLRGRRKRYLSLLIAAIVILVLSGSRAGILAGVLGGFVYFAFHLKYVRKVKIAKILLGILVSAVLVVALSGRFSVTSDNFRSVQSRLVVWPATLEMLAKRPIIGYGIETFPLSFAKYADPKLLELERPDIIFDRAHNNILDILSQVGLIGLSYYLMVCFWLFKKFFQAMHKKKPEVKEEMIAVMSAFLAFFTANLFGFAVTAHLVIASFLLAYFLYLVSDRHTRKELKFLSRGAISKVLITIVTVFVFGSIVFQNLFIGIADYKAKAGFKALSKGDMSEVLINFSSAEQFWPNQSYYNYLLSELLIEAKEWDVAMSYAEKGGKFTSYKDSYYFLLKAKILSGKAQIDTAGKAFSKAYELAPSYPPILLHWGIMYVQNDECEPGMKKLKEYLALLPDDWKKSGTEDYRLFYKHNPDFDEVFKYIDKCKINN